MAATDEAAARDQQLGSSRAQIALLESQIDTLKAECAEIQAKLKNQNAQATVNKHIRLLHQYNDIRDVGMGLMGIIADNRGMRVRDVYDEYGVATKD